MLDAVKHGLRALLHFEGRDGRQAFWFFALFNYLITMALSLIVTMPLMLGTIVTDMQGAIAHSRTSDPATAERAAQAMIAQSVNEMVPVMLLVGLASGVILLTGLAASFVRRLHDSGLSGWWSVLPGAMQVGALALMPSQMERMTETMASMNPGDPLAGFSIFSGDGLAGAILGWGAIALVVALGVRKSDLGANRYGADTFNV